MTALTPPDLSLRLQDYDFLLPEAQIAQFPVEPRHASRLLVVRLSSDTFIDATVADLPQWLPKGALLVANNTKVVPARLLGRKATGGRVELLLTRPELRDGGTLLGLKALCRAAKPLQVGQVLTLDDRDGVPTACTAVVKDSLGGGEFSFDFNGLPTLSTLLDTCGHVPLPPYIRGGVDQPELDLPRYQCTFAAHPGAVAAPTAGLHLSTDLLSTLDSQGFERAYVTLHVGPGTFLPVRTADLATHRVLPERFDLSEETAQSLAAARRQGRPIVAVGTTTVRTLESAAQQWQNLGKALEVEDFSPLAGDADLTILPGHQFALVDGLMTNFHLPQSSLLVLVCALAGRRKVLAAYEHAVRSGYRFYSYGDAMIIVP